HACRYSFPTRRSSDLLLTGSTTEMSDFQRIADEEEAAPAPRAPTREIEAAHVRDFVDEVVDESSRGFSFQRVSDEEESQLRSERSEEHTSELQSLAYL